MLHVLTAPQLTAVSGAPTTKGAPPTATQPKVLLPGCGDLPRAAVGRLGVGENLHQDLGIKECPQQAAETTAQVVKQWGSTTYIDTLK